MRSGWLKALGIFRLAFVTPVLGLLPLLLLTEVVSPYGGAGRFAVTLLRDLRGIAFADPVPDVSHVSFYDLASGPAWAAVSVSVLLVSAWWLYYWWRLRAGRAA